MLLRTERTAKSVQTGDALRSGGGGVGVENGGLRERSLTENGGLSEQPLTETQGGF